MAPMTGAATGPTTNIACMTNNTDWRFSAVKASLTMAVVTAQNAPAPSACSTRSPMSTSMVGDSAHRALAMA